MYTIFLLLFSFMVQNYFICFIKLLFLYFLFILYLLCSVSSLLSKLLYPRIAGCPYFHGYNLWGKNRKPLAFCPLFKIWNWKLRAEATSFHCSLFYRMFLGFILSFLFIFYWQSTFPGDPATYLRLSCSIHYNHIYWKSLPDLISI